MTEHTCGGCAACCHHISVHSYSGPVKLDKPAFTPCPHGPACGLSGSCAVYAERPKPCRDFKCAWLLNHDWPDQLRPDRCGVIFELNSDTPGVAIAIAARLELLQGRAVQALLRYLVKRHGVSVAFLSPDRKEIAFALAK